ncbi:MAG: hypothetical protein SNJ59_16345 [Aggregatilineales bacterium]
MPSSRFFNAENLPPSFLGLSFLLSSFGGAADETPVKPLGRGPCPAGGKPPPAGLEKGDELDPLGEVPLEPGRENRALPPPELELPPLDPERPPERTGLGTGPLPAAGRGGLAGKPAPLTRLPPGKPDDGDENGPRENSSSSLRSLSPYSSNSSMSLIYHP